MLKCHTQIKIDAIKSHAQYNAQLHFITVKHFIIIIRTDLGGCVLCMKVLLLL